MRLQGMVGDQVTIKPDGKGWRPPEWITDPENPEQGSTSAETQIPLPEPEVRRSPEKPRKFRNVSHREGREGPWRRNSRSAEDYDVEAGRPFDDYVEEGARQPLTRRQQIMEKHREHLRKGIRGHIKLSFWQRICALLLSISVGLSLLGIIATLLSSKLDALETKLDTRATQAEIPNKLYPALGSGAPSSSSLHSRAHSSASALKFRRRLMGRLDDIGHSQANATRAIPLRTTFSSLARALASFIRITSLVADEADRPAATANVLMGAAASVLNSRYPRGDSSQFESSSLGPPPTRHQLDGVSASLQLELQKMLFNMLQKRAVGSVQIPPSASSFPASAPSPASAPPTSLYESTSNPANPIFRPEGSGTSFQATSQIKRGRANGLQTASSRQPVPQSSPATSTPEFGNTNFGQQQPSFRQRSASLPTKQGKRLGSPVPQPRSGGPVPEAIEMWDLPESKHICRIYRVCKMQDGTILLPQWMERHSERIKSSCGLKKVEFLLENSSGPTNLFAIRHEKKHFPSGIFLSIDHKDRDVFGESAPRDHMPHFVSDSFKSLASIEALMGSGKGRLESSQITPSTGGKEPSKTESPFADLKPSLQIFDGTMAHAQTDWVPSVARMFSKLGFEFGPAGKEKPDEKELKAARRNGMCFRSAIVNNLKQYEPHGIFDENRNNVLFAANGISRDDPALLPGMKGNPCTVAITALTRKGPRALLGLPELESVLYAMGQRLGIKTKFQVVDFTDEVPVEEQVRIMQTSNVLVATHGAGNSNYIFMRPQASVIEIFPFSYRAGPFNQFANVFDLEYRYAMSVPQSDVFKECMSRHEKKPDVKAYAFKMWDEAVEMDKKDPFVHRLQFETEFGKPGESEGMVTRQCVRMQELEFDVNHVASMAIESARQQCQRAQQ